MWRRRAGGKGAGLGSVGRFFIRDFGISAERLQGGQRFTRCGMGGNVGGPTGSRHRDERVTPGNQCGKAAGALLLERHSPPFLSVPIEQCESNGRRSRRRRLEPESITKGLCNQRDRGRPSFGICLAGASLGLCPGEGQSRFHGGRRYDVPVG